MRVRQAYGYRDKAFFELKMKASHEVTEAFSGSPKIEHHARLLFKMRNLCALFPLFILNINLLLARRAGFSYYGFASKNIFSSIVQLVERRTVNPYVTGSSPVGGAKLNALSLTRHFCFLIIILKKRKNVAIEG